METSQNAWFKSKAEHDCHYYYFNELYSFRTIKTFSCDKICSGCISHMFASPIFTRHYYFNYVQCVCVARRKYSIWTIGNKMFELFKANTRISVKFLLCAFSLSLSLLMSIYLYANQDNAPKREMTRWDDEQIEEEATMIERNGKHPEHKCKITDFVW